MRQTIIAVTNEKGGTAKTTTSVSLSAALGALGQQVLLVDLDGQAAASRWLGVEEDNRLAEAMSRGGTFDPLRDVLPGVSLVPASGRLDSVAHELRPTQGGRLRKLLTQLEGFDYVLIDCPPSLGNRLIANALMAASHVIVPVETSILALDGLKILLTTLDDIREGFAHDIQLGGVLACRFDARTKLSRLVLAELRRALPGKVFETVIRENVRMRECPASGQSILTFAPDSHGADDYRALAREILAQPERWGKAQAEARTAPDPEIDLQVADLREHAAASVRQATRDATWRGPAQREDESLSHMQPEQAEEAPREESAEAAGEASEAPPAPAGPESEGTPPSLEVSIAELEEAASRLEDEKRQGTQPAAEQVSPDGPAETSPAEPAPAPMESVSLAAEPSSHEVGDSPAEQALKQWTQSRGGQRPGTQDQAEGDRDEPAYLPDAAASEERQEPVPLAHETQGFQVAEPSGEEAWRQEDRPLVAEPAHESPNDADTAEDGGPPDSQEDPFAALRAHLERMRQEGRLPASGAADDKRKNGGLLRRVFAAR